LFPSLHAESRLEKRIHHAKAILVLTVVEILVEMAKSKLQTSFSARVVNVSRE